MRCLVACCFALSLLSAISGCHSCDRVESELRSRENDVLTLREELDRCGVYNQALQQENHALRGQLGIPPGVAPPAAYPVQKMTIGPRSGGRSNDICPGDDSLQVQVEPRDPDNTVIKVPGQVLIQALEINSEGLKRPLSTWMIPPDLLRKSWVNGLLTTGYLLNLPWKVWPSTEKLRITATFQLLDGRVFEADRDVTVRLTPINQRPTVVPNTNTTPSREEKLPPKPVQEEKNAPPLLPAPRIIAPGKPTPPPSSSAVPAPFPGVLVPMPTPAATTELPLDPPAAEMLRPLPLKPQGTPPPTISDR